jgi:hypothetical protein
LVVYNPNTSPNPLSSSLFGSCMESWLLPPLLLPNIPPTKLPIPPRPCCPPPKLPNSELSPRGSLFAFSPRNPEHVVYTFLPDCHLVIRSYSLPVGSADDENHYLVQNKYLIYTQRQNKKFSFILKSKENSRKQETLLLLRIVESTY